jgi:hypothetical protein
MASSHEGAHATGGARVTNTDRRRRFGGIKWGAAFFGWLSANGLAVMLLALLSAAGITFGLVQAADPGQTADEAADTAVAELDAIGLTGGITLIVVLFLAYLAGGYVAGRMARFDGGRQGVAVWVLAVLVTLALALVSAVLGAEYDVLSRLDLPSLPVGGDTVATAGIVALVAAVLVSLAGAVLGGRLGTRYHRKIDDAGR